MNTTILPIVQSQWDRFVPEPQDSDASEDAFERDLLSDESKAEDRELFKDL